MVAVGAGVCTVEFMSSTSLPAVFLEHLRSLLDQGQPVYAALPEAARLCGYDQAIVAREWALLASPPGRAAVELPDGITEPPRARRCPDDYLVSSGGVAPAKATNTSSRALRMRPTPATTRSSPVIPLAAVVDQPVRCSSKISRMYASSCMITTVGPLSRPGHGDRGVAGQGTPSVTRAQGRSGVGCAALACATAASLVRAPDPGAPPRVSCRNDTWMCGVAPQLRSPALRCARRQGTRSPGRLGDPVSSAPEPGR